MPFKLNKASEQELLIYISGYFTWFNLLAREARCLKGAHRRKSTEMAKEEFEMIATAAIKHLLHRKYALRE